MMEINFRQTINTRLHDFSRFEFRSDEKRVIGSNRDLFEIRYKSLRIG